MVFSDAARSSRDLAAEVKERTRVRRAAVHATRALLQAALIAVLLGALVAGTAFAGKGKSGGGGGGNAGGGTVALVMVEDANGNGSPNWNETITFSVTTSVDRPFVSLNCYQGSSWVYADSVGFFPDYPWSTNFILNAASWPGGAADCTARLYTTKDGIRTTTLATMAFTAGA